MSMGFNPKSLAGGRLRKHFPDPSMTKQSFKDECDINRIVARAAESGFFGSIADGQPLYADVSHVPDYQSALNTVIAARDRFMQMPAEIRERFANDPAKMVSFLGDPKNIDEGRKLGLLKPAPIPDPVVEPAKPADPAKPTK